METIKVSEFKKNIFKKGDFQQYIVYPYFTDEDEMHSRVLVISDKVQEVTMVKNRNKRIALILPVKNSLKETLNEYKDKIKSFVGVDAPVFSIYDFKNVKIAKV